jgi:hypothetical protein
MKGEVREVEEGILKARKHCVEERESVERREMKVVRYERLE